MLAVRHNPSLILQPLNNTPKQMESLLPDIHQDVKISLRRGKPNTIRTGLRDPTPLRGNSLGRGHRKSNLFTNNIMTIRFIISSFFKPVIWIWLLVSLIIASLELITLKVKISFLPFFSPMKCYQIFIWRLELWLWCSNYSDWNMWLLFQVYLWAIRLVVQMHLINRRSVNRWRNPSALSTGTVLLWS